MNRIQILDCTLRDGGYCNEWDFGYDNAKRIVSGLIDADVEIVECGFLTDRVEYQPNITRFSEVDQIKPLIPENRNGHIFVAMVNYGEYNAEDIPLYDGSSVDGFRVAFHKKDLAESLLLCKQIKEKGYLVFIQAMVSLNYNDEEFLSLIRAVNEIEPYAFYIVDSFGMMKGKDLIRLFHLVEHNLNKEIKIGFHSHNNLQLAYSNAQTLTTVQTNRDLIIDTSIMGMGRGAGNLNTELFVDYLNENREKHYEVKPLLMIIDKILGGFYERNYWGYSLPNYISATHNAHPNYASYLDAKKTLTFEDMNEIFDMMDSEKKVSFDKMYIEELYLKYQEKDRVQESHLNEFDERIKNKEVLMIAPGQSTVSERDKIVACAQRDNVVTISTNYEYDESLTDFVFVSNLRRFRDLSPGTRQKSIVTSNIPAVDVYLQVLYKDLLNLTEPVQDNAGLMLIRFLIMHGVKRVYIAGMDGYSPVSDENYANQAMDIYTKKQTAEKKNAGMISVLKAFQKELDIEMLTTPKYITID